jgi:hypothetical protein
VRFFRSLLHPCGRFEGVGRGEAGGYLKTKGKKERKLAEDYSNIENQMKMLQRSEIRDHRDVNTIYNVCDLMRTSQE